MLVKNWFNFLFLGLVWGSSFLWIENTLHEAGPLTFPAQFYTHGALLWLGLLGSCIITLAWLSLLYAVGPAITRMIPCLFPLAGVFPGAIFPSEKVDWRVLAGGGLILLAIFIVSSRQYRIKPEPAALLVEIEDK